MNGLAAALLAILALAGLVAGWVWLARRQGAAAATTVALAQTQTQTIKNLKDRKETDDAVNADPDLVKRASKWVRPGDNP